MAYGRCRVTHKTLEVAYIRRTSKRIEGVFPLSQHFEKIQVNMCWLSGNGTGRQQKNLIAGRLQSVLKIYQENILWHDLI